MSSIISKPNRRRHAFTSRFWKGRRKSFFGPIAGAFVMTLLVFTVNLCYMYGSMFKSGTRTPALKVLALDYDGSLVGDAMETAYMALKGNSFPTLEYASTADYPDNEAIQEAVCKRGYWGAIWSASNATSKLVNAVGGSSDEAYDPTAAIRCMYSGVYYPVVEASYIQPSMRSLIAAAGSTIHGVSGSGVLRSSVNLTDSTSAAAFLSPISSSGCIVIFPTEQGMRVLLNTVTIVVGPLMQFFFSMAMNNISGGVGVLSQMRVRDVYLFRLVVSKMYTFLGGLAITGCIWAFREGWTLANGGKFMETWMCLWLYLEVNYLVIDTVLVTVIPLAFFSFFIFSWVFLNVTSTVWPFELSAGFYRWGWAIPGHNAWILLMGVWSNGCRMEEKVTLSVMFMWWFVGHCTSAWSVWRRCTMSEAAEEEGIPDPDMLPIQPHRSHASDGGGNRQSVMESMHSFASWPPPGNRETLNNMELATPQKDGGDGRKGWDGDDNNSDSDNRPSTKTRKTTDSHEARY